MKTPNTTVGRWVAMECAPAIALILVVCPISWLYGEKQTLKTLLIAGAHTLASGDLLAAGFCFLLPMLAYARHEDKLHDTLLMRLTIALVVAASFYWVVKLKPLTLPINGAVGTQLVWQAFWYSAASVGVSFFAITTAYRARLAIS